MKENDEADVGIRRWDGRSRGLAGGAPGAPLWLPDDGGDTEAGPSAPASGSLATSGRDDVLRGDTVTGPGAADIGAEHGGRRRAVEPGPQSGQPTPGNRYGGEATDDDSER